MITIAQLVDGLLGVRDEDFTCDGIYEFLGANPVDLGSLARYLFWSDKFYTRNLIYKDARFEVMALCWEKGQVSRVHNHADQKCWMSVVSGKLRGQNFAIDEIDEKRGHCKLRETDRFDLSECLAAKVELEEPIHQILNLADFGERAISIHVYSKPFDSCLSYCLETNTFREVNLCYTSVEGKLMNGISL
ncbi:MAG: cysteine dioxygenase family protein [Acidobacteria bacterium]|nr:cysteine dioxygenase family protein [Acidobacteriota bacterium]